MMTTHEFRKTDMFTLATTDFMHLIHNNITNKFIKRYKDIEFDKIVADEIQQPEYNSLLSEYTNKDGFTHTTITR